MNIKGSSALVLGALCLTGCASVTRGVNEDVQIKVNPSNAKIRTSTGHACTGSCTINVPRKKTFTVTASAPGYQTEIIEVETRVGGKGAVALAGNAIVGGVIGIGVDAVSGAALDHYPNPVVINLERGRGSKRVIPKPKTKSEPVKPVS